MDDNASATTADTRYMRRALQLARLGGGHVSPNPMVGAVVTARGRIIGEGWHRRWGQGHAEVNALASVRPEDLHLLPEATVYVTLEPCSHYGKTPPCAKLLVDRGVRRVVVGAPDPNPLVSGRGVRMLREAGIEVDEGLLRDECEALNVRFMTAQRLGRPHITLKWAQSADGFMAAPGPQGRNVPVSFSTPLTALDVHRLRSLSDAIMVGTDTVIADNPRLDTRLWPGRSPRPVLFSSGRLPADAAVMQRDPLLLDPSLPLADNMSLLWSRHGISSLLVEGGPTLLRSFLDAGLYDRIRVETSPLVLGTGLPAPDIRDGSAGTGRRPDPLPG